MACKYLEKSGRSIAFIKAPDWPSLFVEKALLAVPSLDEERLLLPGIGLVTDISQSAC